MTTTRILTALLLATTLAAAAPAQIFGIFPGPDEAPVHTLEEPPIFEQGPWPEESWQDLADYEQCIADGLCLDFPPFLFTWDEASGLFYDPGLHVYFDEEKGHFYSGDSPWGTPLFQLYQPNSTQGGGGKAKTTARNQKPGKKKPRSKISAKTKRKPTKSRTRRKPAKRRRKPTQKKKS
jgi:hypothetical protein